MAFHQQLVNAIIKFLANEIKNKQPSEELSESLEVAMQCLESAYGIDNTNEELQSKEVPLPELYRRGRSVYDANPYSDKPAASEEAKILAEEAKMCGNEHVKNKLLFEACEEYTRAIQFDSNNAVYYCNRAAAYNKLGNFQAAIMDCKTAVKIDPKYGKAYGRMGVALASLHRHAEALKNYEMAMQLEPENQTYINNYNLSYNKLNPLLQMAAKKAADQSTATPSSQPTTSFNVSGNLPGGGGGGAGAGFDLNSMLNHPTLINMASQVLLDPNMQTMIQSMMASSGIESLMSAGQTLAERIQQQNPELIDTLRRQMGPAAGLNPEQQEPQPQEQQVPQENRQQPPEDGGDGGGDAK